ncbi:MAG TPA: bifunctional [glutamate--ammonia ligase]-adenylyl-L-tyrosine phosphorylase/[glutamate--ammonia-ligase] adenylyltransferase [Candidatus Polarisedimenticolia bacterium]|jgi:glutamate-ammonia-ligase adenylyltransferase
MPAPLSEEILELCRRTLDDAARGIADIERIGLSGEGNRLGDFLARLLPEAPDPDLALVHLERYCRHNAPPRDLQSFEILLTLFGFSPYLGEALINDPGHLPHLARARSQGTWGVEEHRNELARWLRIAHTDDPWDALRVFKRRATLRIALRDLQRSASFPEVCREISAVADALIQCGIEIALSDLVERYGRPRAYDDSGRLVPAEMTVVALGKLGGMELNYSSDVDLLFLYSADGETSGLSGRSETQITNKEFFTRAAELLAQGLGQISREGQVYRVDCRLRPGGRDGDLVTPVQAALVYYQTWSRAWERQALIKARPCAGDPGLGAKFLEEAQRIVYTDPPNPAIVDGIRGMKDLIDADLALRRRGATDLKLGMGGIREIEFTVQAFQLLQGCSEPWIREPNTLLALHRLADKGYLSVQQYGSLTAAYTFLREAEHRVQLHRNLQRSTLPAAGRDLRVLARAMGYRDTTNRQEAARFLSDLEVHRGTVRSIYDKALGSLSQARLEEPPAPDPFLDPMSDAEALGSLAAAGIRDGESLLGGVRQIARLLDPKVATAAIRREFRRAAPVVLKELTRAHNPVRALRNLGRYLASLGLDQARMLELLERRELLPPLVQLFAGSQPLSSTLINRPDLILEGGFDLAVARERGVGEHLQRIMEARASCSDSQELAAFLRGYHRNQVLFIGLKDLSRQASPEGIARALSDLAEAIVRAAVAICAAHCGWPISEEGDTASIPGFVVLALGKLGYRELDYSSDLDLVFLYDAGEKRIAERHAAANRLAATIVDMLTTMTREGSLYSVDARLRPYGGEGELAQPIHKLAEYFTSSAAVWEMQSFLKARPLAGDLTLGSGIVEEVEGLVFERASRVDLAREVLEMKARLEHEAAARAGGRTDIKAGPGGLNTIQFTIQFLQLAHRIPSPALKGTTRLLATLRTAELLDEETYEVLFTGYQFLRRLEHQNRLIHGRALSRLPSAREALDEIASSMGYVDAPGASAGLRLTADLETHLRRIEATYHRVVEGSTLERAARN